MNPRLYLLLVAIVFTIQYAKAQRIKDGDGLPELTDRMYDLFRERVKENEMADGEVWRGVSMVLGVKKTSWKTAGMYNESVFLSPKKRFAFLVSMDKRIEAAGYKRSLTMMDFDSGMFGIKIPMPGGAPRSNNRRGFRRVPEVCFIGMLPNSLAETELLRRSTQGVTSLTIGTPITAVARKDPMKRGDMTSKSRRLATFCKRAIKKDMAYHLEIPGTPPQNVELFGKVLGHLDGQQASVPYNIQQEV